MASIRVWTSSSRSFGSVESVAWRVTSPLPAWASASIQSIPGRPSSARSIGTIDRPFDILGAAAAVLDV